MEGLRIVDVKVLAILDASTFIGLALDDSNESRDFEDLSNYVNDHYRNEKPMSVVVQSPHPDKIYCVRSSTDQTWCRTKVDIVFQASNGPLAQCYLIDFHRKENINLRWLRECPSEFRKLPTQARRYTLYGIQPISMKTDVENFTTSLQPCKQWDSSALTYVKTRLKERASVKVEVWRDNADAVQCLVFLAEALGFECLNDVLVEKEFARHTDITCKGRTLPVVGVFQETESCKGDLEKIFGGAIATVPTQVLKAYTPPRRPSFGQPPGHPVPQREPNPFQHAPALPSVQSRVPSHFAQPQELVRQPPQLVRKDQETPVSAGLAVLGKYSPANSSDEQSPPKIVRRRTPNSSSKPRNEVEQQMAGRSTAVLALSGDIYPTSVRPQPAPNPALQMTPHCEQGDSLPAKRLFDHLAPEVVAAIPPEALHQVQAQRSTSVGHGQVPSVANPMMKVADLPPIGRGYGRGAEFSSFEQRTLGQKPGQTAMSPSLDSSVGTRSLSPGRFVTPQLHHPPTVQRTANVELPKPAALNDTPSPPNPLAFGRGRGIINPNFCPAAIGQNIPSLSSQTSPSTTPFIQAGKPETSLCQNASSVPQPVINTTHQFQPPAASSSHVGFIPSQNTGLQIAAPRTPAAAQNSSSDDFNSPVRPPSASSLPTACDSPSQTARGLASLTKNPAILKMLPEKCFENLTTKKMEALLDLISAVGILSKEDEEDKNEQGQDERFDQKVPPANYCETTMANSGIAPAASLVLDPRINNAGSALQRQDFSLSNLGQVPHAVGGVTGGVNTVPSLTQPVVDPAVSKDGQSAKLLERVNKFFCQQSLQQASISETPVNISGSPHGIGYQPSQFSPQRGNSVIEEPGFMSVPSSNPGQSLPKASPVIRPAIPSTESHIRQPLLTSPSMCSSVGDQANQVGVTREESARNGYSMQQNLVASVQDVRRDNTQAMSRPSPNMMPSSSHLASPASVPVRSPLSATVGSEEEKRSGSDSGSTSTGSKLMSRLPKLATSKKTSPVVAPVERSDMFTMIMDEPRETPTPTEKPLRSILKKASPSSVYFSDSDKEGTLMKKKVNLSLPTQREEAGVMVQSPDSDSDGAEPSRLVIRRECHRSRRLLEMINPEVYERRYLRTMLSMSMSGFDSVIINDSGVITDGEIVPKKPTLQLESSHLAEYIKNRLAGKNFPLPTKIQSWCWPAILRGLNVIGIAPPRRGKTLAYMAPLATLILQKDSYTELPSGNGPIAVILAGSWKSAMLIFDHCQLLVGGISDARTKMIHGDGDEENMIIELMNGCDILIATPHCLNRMLAGKYTNFERLCHLVVDDGDVLIEEFTEEVRSILDAYNDAIDAATERSVPNQIMLFSSQWTQGFRSFHNRCMLNPAVIISSSFEAAIYGGVEQIPDVCPADQRFQKLPGILEELSHDHEKIIIFTNTPEEADAVYKLLQNYCFHALLYTHAMLTEDIEMIQREWKQPHDAQSKPVLVMTDGGIRELQITDTTCVIHYTMSETKTKFGNRLGCMEDHLKVISRDSEKLVSYILISQECGRQAPTLLRLLRRIGVNPPKNLELLAAGVMEGREEGKQQPLCHYLKSYGRCRDINKCPSRHVISAEIDQPDPEIPLPKNGEVKVLITHVTNASHFYARIQEHRQFSGADGKVTKNTTFAEAVSMLHFKVLQYFQAESRRVHCTSLRVGELCAVDDRRGVYSRARVLQVPRRLSDDAEIEVIYVDEGRTDTVQLKHIYVLPDHLCLDKIPPTVVEIYICGVKPKDEDIEWTTKASLFVYNLIIGMELNGTIVLSLGTTLWLEHLTQLAYLPQLKETIHQYSVKRELLSHKLGVKNPEHMSELYKLCHGKVALPLLTVPKKGGVPKFTYTLGSVRTEVLPESDQYHEVCVSAVITPHLFFVQKFANQDEIEGMYDEINKDAESLEAVDPNMITSGMLCLGKFSQTDSWYRAQVLSMKENKYEAFFVDYGDKEFVSLDCLRTLPEKFAKLPLQAMECALVKVSPTGNKWDEAASDAFWDMCVLENGDRKKLFARVRSRTNASLAGMHKCHVEVTDTTSSDNLLLSQELVTAGHALATPESVQELFPDLDLDLEVEVDETEKIPFFCARMYLSNVATDSVTLAQACKDIVAENDRSDLLKAGAHLAMCKVVAFLPEQTSQYLLLQAISTLLDEDSAKEEAYQSGVLRNFCRILSKESSSTLSQLEVAKMLCGFSGNYRYCYEIGHCGGIKHLCTLAGAVKQEHICLTFLRCLFNVCNGHRANCDIVKDCGGIRILSRLLVNYDRKENMEYILDLLYLLVENLESTDVMRKNGTIESLVLNLGRTVHVDLIGDMVELLSILSGHSAANKKVMREEGISEALEKHCRRHSRCSEEVRTKCKELYRLFNPAGYIEPELRQLRPMTQVNGGTHIENTPIIERDIMPSKRVPAEVLWSQKSYWVLLIIKVPEVKKHVIDCKHDGLIFRATVQETEYYVNLELFADVMPEDYQVRVLPSCVMVGLKKAVKARWLRLLKHRGKPSYIKIDMERYVNSSSESEGEGSHESPFVFRQKKSLGDFLADERSDIPKYLNARPEPEHVAESSDSDSDCPSDEFDSGVMRWADKDEFDIFAH
ncbi:uncharacterized protein LOC135496154 isoform X2 [Lineus longissimus]|uniref:uncharacterized protein LOC135496154 isoform X2 n=1 Tax=Lineus longissimus TaxID=88925 RepID=UPI00315DBB8F